MVDNVSWGALIAVPRNFPYTRIDGDTPTKVTRYRFFGFFTQTKEGPWSELNPKATSAVRYFTQWPKGSPAYTEVIKFINGI